MGYILLDDSLVSSNENWAFIPTILVDTSWLWIIYSVGSTEAEMYMYTH